MANPNFDGLHSTHNIWRADDETRCLSDDLDAIESDIEALDAGKADADHTHTGYAASGHTHTGYAANDHTHTPASIGAAASGHTHTPASIGAAGADHSHNYAAPTHSHAQAEITGLADALAAKADASAMSGKADLVNGLVPASQLPSFVDDVLEYANLAAFPATGESGKIYVALNDGKTYRWSGTVYAPVGSDVALGETSATAYRGDRGKIAYDHSQNSDIHVTAAQKTSWDSKAAGNHGHSYNDLTDKPTIPTIPSSLPANGGDADTVDGKHASDFAEAVHNHDSEYIAKALQFTADNGGVQYAVNKSDNTNVLTVIAALPIGVHTVYSQSGVTGNPKTTEAWRCIVHKTGSTVMWVLGFGSMGSVYSNYCADSVWQGWKCIHDANPGALWSGNYYMNGAHTVIPSKKLSECKNGWLLVWSDYDPDTNTVNDEDFVTSMIHKRKPGGTAWNGQSHYFDIPRYIGDTITDVTTESRIMKRLYVYDNKLVGYEGNNQSNARKDVVLRAIYEF